MGKIISIDKQKTITNESVLTDYWVIENASNIKITNWINCNCVQDSVVCIYTPAIDDTDVISTIGVKAVESRIYVLVGQKPKNPEQFSNCLTRIGGDTTVSFILVKSNTGLKGLFFTGSLSKRDIGNSNHLVVEISDSKKTNDLYLNFCYNFWKNADKEYIDGKEFSVSKDAPFDVFDNSSRYRNNFVFSTLFEESKSTRDEYLNKKLIKIGDEGRGVVYEVKQELVKDLSSQTPFHNLVSYEELDKYEPTLPDADTNILPVNVIYKWNIMPFYLSSGARKHPNYQMWEDVKSKFTKQIDSLKKKIEEVMEKKDTFKKIIPLIMGKHQKFNELKRVLGSIESELSSISDKDKVGVKELIEKINQIGSQIEGHSNELEKENKKTIIKEDIEKIKSEYQDLQSKISNSESEISDLQKKIEDCKSGIETLKNQKADYKYIETELKKLETEQTSSKRNLNSLISDLDRRTKELKQKESELDNIDSKENKSSHLNVLKKNNNNMQNVQKESNSFEIKDIPPYLPKVGELFINEGRNYLAISDWDDYALGKSESERLNAILCATNQ